MIVVVVVMVAVVVVVVVEVVVVVDVAVVVQVDELAVRTAWSRGLGIQPHNHVIC